MLGKLLLRFLEHYKLGWILLQLRKWMKPGENPIRIAFPSRKNLMPSPFNPLKLSLDSCCLEIDVHNRGNRCSPTQPENKIIKERRQEKEKGYHPLNIKTGFTWWYNETFLGAKWKPHQLWKFAFWQVYKLDVWQKLCMFCWLEKSYLAWRSIGFNICLAKSKLSIFWLSLKVSWW